MEFPHQPSLRLPGMTAGEKTRTGVGVCGGAASGLLVKTQTRGVVVLTRIHGEIFKGRAPSQPSSSVPCASRRQHRKIAFYKRLTTLFINHYFHDLIALSDLVYDVDAFSHFSKYRMLAIQVLGVLAIVTDEKLRSAGVSARMRH